MRRPGIDNESMTNNTSIWRSWHCVSCGHKRDVWNDGWNVQCCIYSVEVSYMREANMATQSPKWSSTRRDEHDIVSGLTQRSCPATLKAQGNCQFDTVAVSSTLKLLQVQTSTNTAPHGWLLLLVIRRRHSVIWTSWSFLRRDERMHMPKRQSSRCCSSLQTKLFTRVLLQTEILTAERACKHRYLSMIIFRMTQDAFEDASESLYKYLHCLVSFSSS